MGTAERSWWGKSVDKIDIIILHVTEGVGVVRLSRW